MMPEEVARLRPLWLGQFAGAQNDQAARQVFDELVKRYAEPERHYHVLEHVRDVLEWLVRLWFPSSPSQPLLLAAWLHDVIYDPRAKDNEERSAEYAQEVLAGLGIQRSTRDEVARLILLTRRHETTEDDKEGQTLLDADLAILGAEEADYDRYADQIRLEYAWVSDEGYRTGRREVLKRFLARPHLYSVPCMRSFVEPRARVNLAREIAALGG